MRILISGVAGFIGSHLADALLAQSHVVVGVDDMSNGLWSNIAHHEKNPNFTFVGGDISKEKNYFSHYLPHFKPDVVYHLACHPRSMSFTNPRRDVEVNLIGLVNILEAVKDSKPRIVFSSNSGIYDSRVQPIREGNPENPVTPYDVDKLASEYMIKAYAQAYGLPYTIFRFATVYGARQRFTSEWNPVVVTFVKTLMDGGVPYITGDGSQTRDFVNVADVVDALLRAKDMEGSADAILLGSGMETKIRALYKLAQIVTGIHTEPEWRARPLGEILRMSYDCSRAEAVLGWRAKTCLREGVLQVYNHLQTHHHT